MDKPPLDSLILKLRSKLQLVFRLLLLNTANRETSGASIIYQFDVAKSDHEGDLVSFSFSISIMELFSDLL